MFFDMRLELLGVELAPMPPALFRGQRALFGGDEIPINGTPSQIKPPGGLGFGAAALNEFHHPFPQVQRIGFHALKPITLCPNVNMKCYIFAGCPSPHFPALLLPPHQFPATPKVGRASPRAGCCLPHVHSAPRKKGAARKPRPCFLSPPPLSFSPRPGGVSGCSHNFICVTVLAHDLLLSSNNSNHLLMIEARDDPLIIFLQSARSVVGMHP